MKKLSCVLLVVILTAVAVVSAGCGCSKSDESSTQSNSTSLNTNALDRIKIYEGSGEKQGNLLVTLKGEAKQAMSDIMQMYAETKNEELKPKKDVSDAKEIYYFELLNYEDDGTPKKSNVYFLYFLGDDTYCYYKEKQHFADGEYYICGKTAVSQQNITDMVNGVENNEKN
ncbi:MAG: hypothetical protein ACI4HL_04850 [Ruminococcus sp.]